MNIGLFVGARPNYIKLYPVYKELSKLDCNLFIYDTEQHYDPNLSKNILKNFNLYDKVKFLGLKKKMFSKYSESIEEVIIEDKLDYGIVFGDINSSLYAAINLYTLDVPIIHVEAGLRSYENDLPEEKNRILIDIMSDILFLSEQSAQENLVKENIDLSKAFLVGNVMIDTLVDNMNKIKQIDMGYEDYYVMTMHRGYNVDDKNRFNKLMSYIDSQTDKEIIFPVHPRVGEIIQETYENIICIKPLVYFEFISLIMNSCGVFTDSGGIQEETSFLNIPCLTFRKSTERPITVDKGTNVLVSDLDIPLSLYIRESVEKSQIDFNYSLWDGNSSKRIRAVLEKELSCE